MRRGTAVLRLLAGGAAALSMAGAAFTQSPLETAVKATDLYKFAAFVDWPATAFGGPGGPIQLCVSGSDPFGAVLDQAVRGQKLGDRPIIVARMDHVERGAPCDILFVAAAGRQSLADALDKVKGAPVLTITDAANDPAARGMIDFVLRDNHVRFRIDARAAEQSGLAISSKLLSLAVKGAP